MDYLIDTHVCLWAVSEKEKLSATVKPILEGNNNKILVSQISFFEIAIKLKIRKLPNFKISLDDFINSVYATGFKQLNLKNEHLVGYSQFEFSEQHTDPFDRLINAAAFVKILPLLPRLRSFNCIRIR